MSRIICLDAGHGGVDSGAVYNGRYEKNDNMSFAKAVKAELEEQGISVIMTRTDDVYVDLNKRTAIANNSKADAFISLHRNAFGNSSAKGIENWIYQGANISTESFAKNILNEVVKVGSQANRGVKRGNFCVTRETNMPSCLLELGFISNTADNNMFDSRFDEYAKAVAKAVCIYFNLSCNDTPTVQPPQTDKLYRVQVGAFKNKSNAVKLCDELKSKGYTAFVTE